MRRREWKEIEDLPGCPRWLRDAMTGYLQVVLDQARPYDVAAPILQACLESGDCEALLDLASGGGGPWPGLLAKISDSARDISVTLTDIEPSRDAATRVEQSPGVAYLGDPVSALDVPDRGHCMWTMFTGPHHFSPGDVKSLMRSAQDRGVMFAAFEATSRSARGLAITLFIPLLVLLMMPRVRPRRLLPLLLTCLPPILPLLIWWDGFVSTLRTYTVAELKTFAEEVGTDGYEWWVEELQVRGAPIPVLALVGGPTASFPDKELLLTG